MSRVALNITMSLDGFVTAPNEGPDRGLGEDGDVLHYDELQLHIAPVILGGGRTLFDELGTRLYLERTRVRESPYATHIDFAVRT